MIEEIFGQASLWLSAIINPIGATVIIWAFLFNKLPFQHKFFKIISVTSAVGLIGQTYRSWYGIATGMAPTDTEMPFWIFKDIGLNLEWIFFMLVAYGYYNTKGNKSL